jgi:hypothetical protein
MRALCSLALLACLCGLMLSGCQNKPRDQLSGARLAENQGNYAQAMESYVSALLQTVPTTPVPDKNQSRTQPEEKYRAAVLAYLTSVDSAAGPGDTGVGVMLAGMARCSSQVARINIATPASAEPLKPEVFKELWRSAFFPQGWPPMPQTHDALIARACQAGLSFVSMTARAGFAYDGVMLSLATGRAAAFHVFAENATLLLARPGENLLVLKAKANFTSGMNSKTWDSPYGAIRVNVPAKPSIVKVTLNTFPNGRKEE